MSEYILFYFFMTISTIITAAGKNSRMRKDQLALNIDLKNKLILPFKDSTVIGTTIDNALKANIDECIVVLGHYSGEIKEAIYDNYKDKVKYWLTFRRECVKRSLQFDLEKKSTKLNLLKGLEKILLDIDKAIKVIRETANDADVVPNLMQAFELDKAQAEFVAEIKLRNLNREYILKKTQEIDSLEKEINWVKESLGSDKAIGEIIIKKLEEIAKKYGKERQTSFILCEGLEEQQEQEEVPNYPVHIFVTKEGYIKKISQQKTLISSHLLNSIMLKSISL